MALKRIYQVAKELNISHLEILDFLKSKDVSVANHMAPVDSDIYDMILVEFSKEKADVERVRKEKARKEIIKTKDSLYDELEVRIKELHPYELPEIISVPIDKGLNKYLDWISESTK